MPRLHIDVNPSDRDQAAELERLLKLGRARPTSARPARSPGTSSPIPKITCSACSRSVSTPSDGLWPGAARVCVEVGALAAAY